MYLIEKAKVFTADAHKNQKYGSLPYIVHPYDVYLVLYERGIRDENILVATWLHDVIEDTNVTYSKIRKEFNEEIAEIVFCLTDELGRNRKERHEKTYPKLQQNFKAIIVKLADRLANNKAGLREKNKLLDMYKREYAEFKAVLKPTCEQHADSEFADVAFKMWDELDKIMEID